MTIIKVVQSMKYMVENFGETLLHQEGVPEHSRRNKKKEKKKRKQGNAEQKAEPAKDSRPVHKLMHDILVNFLESDGCELNVAEMKIRNY